MSDELPSGETGKLRDPSELPHPVLWPEPSPGAAPVPMHGRDRGGELEQVARRRLPLAWAGIGTMLVAAVILGFAIGRHSWILAAIGLVVGALGGAMTLWSRIMDAATIGQSVRDE